MPNYKNTKREQARYLYFNTSKTQREIARVLEVTEKTLSTWARRGRWADIKKSTLYSSEQELHNLFEELKQINYNIQQREPGLRYSTKEELDAKAKIIAIITGPLGSTATWRNLPTDFNYSEVYTSKSLADYHDVERTRFNMEQSRNSNDVIKNEDGTVSTVLFRS